MTRMANLGDPIAKARDSDVVIRHIIRVERFRTARWRLSRRLGICYKLEAFDQPDSVLLSKQHKFG